MNLLADSKCPIKQYSSSKYITGNTLLVHQDFSDRVKVVEKAAKDCKVRVYITGSYYQLQYPTEQVPYLEQDLVIGHALKFELHNENNGILCNKLCLSKSKTNLYKIFLFLFVCLDPMDLYEVKCFLQSVQNNGLSWSRYITNVLSDGTYASDPNAYEPVKIDIQTKCQGQSLKRKMFREVRRIYEVEQESEEGNNSFDDEKKK
jgi:hypothetical protein